MEKKDHLAGRYVLFIIGLFIAALGVALSTKAGLGTSPVASVPFSISLLSGLLTFGGWLNLWSIMQISVEVILLRSKCNPVEIIIQTILALTYGYMTNFWVDVIQGLNTSTYPAQFACMLAGCIVLAFGIWLQFKGGVAMLPGEAMNRAIAYVTHFRYENIKIFFDVAYILAAAAICMIAFGKLEGVREGSIIAAIVIGNIIKFFNRTYDRFVAGRKSAQENSGK